MRAAYWMNRSIDWLSDAELFRATSRTLGYVIRIYEGTFNIRYEAELRGWLEAARQEALRRGLGA